MKNKLSDLNNHLFEQLERLNDDDLIDEELEKEIRRSKAIALIAGNIIENGSLMLDAKKHIDEFDVNRVEMPEMLQINQKNNA